MSSYIGYDLLKGEALRVRLLEEAEEGPSVENPFKVTLLQLLSHSLSSEHAIATTILLNLAHNTILSPVIHSSRSHSKPSPRAK